MPVALKSTHLAHGRMTQTAKQSCEVQEFCKEGKHYPNNGILKAQNLPEPLILCFLVLFVIKKKNKLYCSYFPYHPISLGRWKLMTKSLLRSHLETVPSAT